MQGYDLDLVQQLCDQIHIPITVLGGAGRLSDVANLWKSNGLLGAAAGSLFVFKGKYRAVLINYPNISEKASLLDQAGWEI